MKINKILIFGYRHIGDSLFITPAISALKEKFPTSYIALICGLSSYEIFKENISIDELIVLKETSFLEKWKIRKFLKEKKFDTVILFQHTLLNALFACLLRIPQRVGLNWKGYGLFLTKKIAYNSSWHEVERYLEIVKLLGADNKNKNLIINLSEEDINFADNFLKENNINKEDFLIGINPGSSEQWKIKRWEKEKFAKLSDELIDKFKAKVIFISSPNGNGLIEEIFSLMKNKPLISPKSSIKQLSALIQKFNLFITNDTGPMHLATAVGTRVIDIVGQSDIKRTGPIGESHIIIRKELPCSPCKKQTCDDLSCLKLITVEEVFKEVEKIYVK